jgi:hypothetical protein
MGFKSFQSFGSKLAIPDLVKVKYIKSFTNTGQTSFLTPSDVLVIEILLIAGGGCGGGLFSGGGGAGGFLYNQNLIVQPNTSYIITVGAGAVGGGASTLGQNSSFADLLLAYGGGYGATFDSYDNGANGGSGGGASSRSQPGTSINGGTGVQYTCGGGGGAGFAGNQNGTSKGGDGLQSSISGTATYYAGGGGGGQRVANVPNNPGGLGGGGEGRGGIVGDNPKSPNGS